MEIDLKKRKKKKKKIYILRVFESRVPRIFGPKGKEVTGRNGHTIVQAVSRRLLTAKTWVRVHISPYGICGGQSGIRIGFRLSVSFHRCSIFTHVSSGGWTMVH
jgi:hypothetical protein